jgi:hypothetical protein
MPEYYHLARNHFTSQRRPINRLARQLPASHHCWLSGGNTTASWTAEFDPKRTEMITLD